MKCLGTGPCCGKCGWNQTRGSLCGPRWGPGCGASLGSWKGTATGCQAPRGPTSTLSSEPVSGVNWDWPPSSCRGDGTRALCALPLQCFTRLQSPEERSEQLGGGSAGCSESGRRQCRHPCLESMIHTYRCLIGSCVLRVQPEPQTSWRAGEHQRD